MTETDRLIIDAAMARALDRFAVPEPMPGFGERIAKMPPPGLAALPPLPRRRVFGDGRRGAWMRRASIGVIALGVASATAAATGFFPPIHLAVPAPLIAMFAPAKAKEHGHPHHERSQPAKLVTAQPTPDAGASPSPLAVPPPPPQLGFVRHFIQRQRQSDVVQSRLAQQGRFVPRQVIDQQLDMREIAFGAAVRGDTQTKLPPAMAVMRDRAIIYLDARPGLRDQLRARAAEADQLEEQRRLARLQSNQAAEAPTPITADAVPGADAAPAPAVAAPPQPSWTERRLRAFRRQQRLRALWAAQADPGPGIVPAPAAMTEGNSTLPR